MTQAAARARPDPAGHPLLVRLSAEFGFPAPALDAFDAFAAQAGSTLFFFADDPDRIKETLDLAVIVPELASEFRGQFRVGVLLPAVANAVAPRYGIRRWPALLMLRDGRYVGSIEGIRDWADYRFQVARLLEIEPSEPPKGLVTSPAARTDGGH